MACVLGTQQNKVHNNMRTQTALASILTGVILALGTVTQVQAADSKATGTWSWTQAGRGGRAGGAGGAAPAATPAKTILKLTAEGEKLTGTITQPAGGGRRGGAGGAAPAAPAPVEISDGKVKGDEISFSVKRAVNGNEFVIKYNGKVDGDKITGKMERPGRNGGDPMSTDWTATREPAAAK